MRGETIYLTLILRYDILRTIEERQSMSLRDLLPKKSEDTPVPADVWARLQGLTSLAQQTFKANKDGKPVVADALSNMKFVLELIKGCGCTKKECGEWMNEPKHIYYHLAGPCINNDCDGTGCDHCSGGVMTQNQRTEFWKNGSAMSEAAAERNK